MSEEAKNKAIEKNIQMSLMAYWFEMTKSGIKTEDYREITGYWFKRLVFRYKEVFKYCSGYDWDRLDVQSREHLVRKICSDPIKIRMFGFNPYDFNIMTLGYPKSTDAETFRLKTVSLIQTKL